MATFWRRPARSAARRRCRCAATGEVAWAPSNRSGWRPSNTLVTGTPMVTSTIGVSRPTRNAAIRTSGHDIASASGEAGALAIHAIAAVAGATAIASAIVASHDATIPRRGAGVSLVVMLSLGPRRDRFPPRGEPPEQSPSDVVVP